MIDKILKNRRYVLEYDQTASISPHLINELLYKTWKVTPSKNNFMPYKIHIVGPGDREYKHLTYKNCLSNEGLADGIDNPVEERYQHQLPDYANILSCSYLFIFTLRLEDKPNPVQKKAIRMGHNYEPADESLLDGCLSTASIEVGLFADCFSALCIKKGIDVSFTGCFHRDIDKWDDIPFVTRTPILIMTAGKSMKYKKVDKNNLRPDYSRIVNFV